MAPKTFSLAGKTLKLDTAEDLDKHIQPLIDMTDVERVILPGNTLGVGACQRLGEVLATKKSLEFADLSDIYTGRLLSEIPDALSSLLRQITNLPNLTTINLSDNAFGINTVVPIATFLSAHVPLQHLYLNNNGFGPQAGVKVADALSELHAKKEAARKEGRDVPDLETIICGRNRLESGSMSAWANTLTLHNKLKTLRMIQNSIRPEGISYLVRHGLSHTKSLEILDLQDNTFSVAGAKEFVKIVPTLANLQDLGISDTVFTNKGSSALFRALGKGRNAKLETLRMQFAEFKAPVLKELLEVCTDHLPVLKKVEINGNKFSEEDETLDLLRELLEKRKETLSRSDDAEDAWGVDSLSDLEDDSYSDESGEDEVDEKALGEKLAKAVAEAKGVTPIPPSKDDAEVDKLAEGLSKVEL